MSIKYLFQMGTTLGILGLGFAGHTAPALSAPAIQQSAESILVDYATENNELILMLSTRPPISGCGKMSNLPIGGGFDNGAIDLHVGPYAFTPAPSGTRGPACGPAYKVSIGRVAVPILDLADRNISRFRLWSGTQVDTFAIDVRDNQLFLTPAGGPGFFKLGARKNKVPDAFKRLAGQE